MGTRQFIWEHQNEKKVHLYTRFQLGNSFANTKMKREVHLYIRFQLGNSFGKTKKGQGEDHLQYIFVFNERKIHLFGATLVWAIFLGPQAIVGLNFILMLLMFGGY